MQKIGVIALLAMVLCLEAAAGEDEIVFQAGDIAVSYEDVERYIVESTPSDPAERAALLTRPDIYRQMAEMLYTLRVLEAEAESMPEFDREQAEWMTHIMYQRRLTKEYRTQYVTQMLQDVDWEATAKEAYTVQKAMYMTEEKVNASHVLITTEGRSDEEALALAREVRKRALDGEDFAELAQQYSGDPSVANNAGDMGFFTRGKMVKPFEDAAFAMQEPGAISEVVESPFGYHIIQFHARQSAQPIPFDTAKAEIIEELQTQMGNKLWQDKLIAIRSDSGIVVNEELLQELQKKYQVKVTPTR